MSPAYCAILIVGGNAYRLELSEKPNPPGLYLSTAGVLTNGDIDHGDEAWGPVAFDLIDDDEKANCRLIFNKLLKIEGEGLPGWKR